MRRVKFFNVTILTSARILHNLEYHHYLHVSMCLCLCMYWYSLNLLKLTTAFIIYAWEKERKIECLLWPTLPTAILKQYERKGAIEKQYNGFSFWHLFDQLVFFSFYRHKKGLHKSWHQKGKRGIENLLTNQSIWQYSGNGNEIFHADNPMFCK